CCHHLSNNYRGNRTEPSSEKPGSIPYSELRGAQLEISTCTSDTEFAEQHSCWPDYGRTAVRDVAGVQFSARQTGTGRTAAGLRFAKHFSGSMAEAVVDRVCAGGCVDAAGAVCAGEADLAGYWKAGVRS